MANQSKQVSLEQRFGPLLELIPDATIMVDASGKIVLANSLAEDLFGYETAELVGQEVELLVPERFREKHREYRGAFMDAPDPRPKGAREELIGLRRDGSEFTGDISLHPLDADGETLVSCTVCDTSARWQAEKEFRYHLELEQLVTSISTKFVRSEPDELDAGIRNALRDIGQFAGVDRSYVFLFSERGKIFDNTYEWCRQGIEPMAERFKLIPVDFFPWASGILKRGEVLHVPDVNALSIDAAAERREWQNQEIRSLVNVPMVSAEGVVGYLGFDSVREPTVWSEDAITLLRFVGELFVNALERKRSARERRRLADRIQQVQRLESLGVLAGGIAHEFNNLLMAILGNASLTLDELPPDSPARENVREIETASTRAAELCKQMLACSGKGHFVIESIDLSDLVKQTGPMLRVQVAKTAVLKLELTEGLSTIRADATQIRQLVMNLISNASDALGKERGTVTVRTGTAQVDRAYLSQTYLDDNLAAGPYVYLEVCDSGCGMSEEAQRRIFDPFYSTKGTGRGLGLAAVLGIVRGHGGAIRCHSELGQGTSIKALFPAHSAPTEVVAETTSPPVPLADGKRRILVVDDEESIRKVAKKSLEKDGYSVLIAQDGQKALEVFRQHATEICAVLLDLTMPKMSGEETFHELRRLRRDIPVVLSSGYSEQEVSRRFLGDRPAGFLQKPYLPSQLLQKVSDVLAPLP